MLTLSSGSVIISNQFYVIFYNTIPQKPVQHMCCVILLMLNEDAMLMLKLFLLLFSGDVSYQTSNNLRSMSQNLAHKPTQAQPTKLSITGTKFSREMDRPPGEIDTARLTEPFITSHLLQSLEGQSTDRYNIVQ